MSHTASFEPSSTRGTGLLLVDPYNDFLSEGGKLHSRAREVMDATGTLGHMKAVASAARELGIPVFYVPHHRALPGDFDGWRHASAYQLGGHQLQVFAAGSWGGGWHPDFEPQPGDVMVREHWSASGFANTDLDLQLKQHGVHSVVLVGLLANTCIEATARFAAELGYHVTLVRDATAAFSPLAMQCAHELNGPTFAHSIVRTAELLESWRAASPAG